MGRRFTDRNESFICVNCGTHVPPSARSCRNHCPECLHSLHVDVFPGDRAAQCGGLMVPIGVEYHSKKGYQIIHRCQRCNAVSRNIAALEDEVYPDSYEALLALMRQGGTSG